ncbi:class I SAM-dependent methyltransferase [Bacteriovorax sp. DB6_IX]|uniref:class I SAM-dependent methyltransferase n=1 Tax=Bacteriovorax sp. DB6_IX TaxID=1353530 RepID=UPI00038A489D|nr:class I SAM-dependent methyltransferase [Bacteriovorax sp. DB6_IX]EQC51980.1 methyltransferase domain protein [Bacteriovorax sp. DB6_IX]
MNCTLCQSSNSIIYSELSDANYFQCQECLFIFQDPATYLVNSEEKARYDTHQNNPEDEGYRKFLSRVVDPLLERIQPGDKGLDFGCGPGPTISVMLEERGFAVDNYDLYFCPETKLIDGSYDFITSTEVFEHFYKPGREIERIWKLLKPGGVLGVMTLFYPETEEEFRKWWYKNDPTHVCFFSPEVFNFLAEKYGAEVEVLSDQVVFLKKPLNQKSS